MLRLQVVEACLTSATAALRLAGPSGDGTVRADRLDWIARAEASLTFAGAELTWLQSSHGRALLRPRQA